MKEKTLCMNLINANLISDQDAYRCLLQCYFFINVIKNKYK